MVCVPSRGRISCVNIRGSVPADHNRANPDPWYGLNTGPDPRIIERIQNNPKCRTGPSTRVDPKPLDPVKLRKQLQSDPGYVQKI